MDGREREELARVGARVDELMRGHEALRGEVREGFTRLEAAVTRRLDNHAERLRGVELSVGRIKLLGSVGMAAWTGVIAWLARWLGNGR